MPPIQLLHLTLSMEAGGIEHLILSMIRHLNKKKYQVTVGCLDKGGVLLDEVRAAGCKTFVLSRKPGLDLHLIFCLATKLRKEKIDILNTHNEAAHFYGCLAARMVGTPVIINVEHSRHYIEGHWRRRVEKRILSLITDKMVTVTRELYDQARICDKISDFRLHTITNGIDVSKYIPDDSGGKCKNVVSLKRKYQISPFVKVVGIIGRLHPVKNHALLFEVMDYLQKTGNDHIVLFVVGEGSYRSFLEKKVKDLGLANKIFFLGYRSDIPNILHALDVLVLCSHTEGLPLTLLEAMAARVPVVVTTGANKSGIVQNGNTGLVAKPTVRDLGEKILRALKYDKMAAIVDSAFDMVHSFYDITHTVAQYDQLYTELLSKKQPRRKYIIYEKS